MIATGRSGFAADQRAAQSKLLDRMFELLGCEIGVLQGHRRQADEPVRLCRADVGELLVLQLDDLTGEVGLRFVLSPDRDLLAARLWQRLAGAAGANALVEPAT